jgi:hypothetical protein
VRMALAAIRSWIKAPQALFKSKSISLLVIDQRTCINRVSSRFSTESAGNTAVERQSSIHLMVAKDLALSQFERGQMKPSTKKPALQMERWV